MDFNQKILNALGPFPAKTEPEFEIISSVPKDGYTQHTVRYNVEPGERITAYLLLPESLKEKNPAILAIHQHNNEYHIGKSEVIGEGGSAMYRYGVELCQRGYVVLAPDLLCFEDRIKDEFRGQHESRRMFERFEFCRYILNGACLQTKYLHDLSVAVDILEGLEYVDKSRIGTVGHSLGGQEATWMMWYDKRLAAGVSSCGIGQVDTIIRDNISHNLALYVPNFQNIGDVSDIVCGIAPRPFFMTSGLYDGELFPVDGVKKIIKNAEDKYRELNAESKFRGIVFDGGHSFADDMKQEVYSWLDVQLGND